MPNNLSREEKALLAAHDKSPRGRRGVHEDDDAEQPTPQRGHLTPVQYEDDGWGDLPVQMRGL